jgi:hypothetical protein
MDAWVDCRYKDAYGKAIGLPNWNGKPAEEWIDRAWVTFFAGYVCCLCTMDVAGMHRFASTHQFCF